MLLDDSCYFTGVDALDIHLNQCQCESSLAALTFFQSSWRKASFANLGHIQLDLARSRFDRLWFVTGGKPSTIGRILVRCNLRVLLPLAGGFEPSSFSVRWIKIQGNGENCRLLRLISPKINMQLAALLAGCFS